jgi:hypothetical protein
MVSAMLIVLKKNIFGQIVDNHLMKVYKRFCCGIYFWESRVNSVVPIVMTYLVTLFLFMLLINGIDTFVFLLFRTPYLFNESWVRYSILLFIAVLNYFFVFKNGKFLEYESRRLNPLLVLAIVVLIFGGSLALILYARPRNLPVQ